MGLLLEALWGYYVNKELTTLGSAAGMIEIAWLPGHEYNDFACVYMDEAWDPVTRTGELLRVESKSMNLHVDESKAHFDELISRIGQFDLLLVLVWSWEPVGERGQVSPTILDYCLELAHPIAELRDQLHIARGGTFVEAAKCPDGCEFSACSHVGEPLNASGKRERLPGPESCRPSQKVAYAANFGGLVRMLKTNSNEARRIFRAIRSLSDPAHEYISFIHRNFPTEERNQYLRSDWRTIASELGIQTTGLTTGEVIGKVREVDGYQALLRTIASWT
jgi:hypothetical protein